MNKKVFRAIKRSGNEDKKFSLLCTRAYCSLKMNIVRYCELLKFRHRLLGVWGAGSISTGDNFNLFSKSWRRRWVKSLHSGDPDVIQTYGLQVRDYSECVLVRTIQLTLWSYI